jgi:integrase
MARVFRHQYSDIDPKTGKRRISRKWYIEFTDANGKRKRIVGFVDRRATDTLASEKEKAAEQIRAGLKPHAAEHSGKNLGELLDLFQQSMTSKRSTVKHIAAVRANCERVFADLEWAIPSQLDAASVQRWLADRQADKRFSAKTASHYRTSLMSFGRWLSPRYALVNPFASGLTVPPAESDRRHVRRSLTADELVRLLDATRSGRTLRGVEGPARALLYETAARTGYRAAELASLLPSMFTLEAAHPVIELPGRFTKNGKPAVQPVPAELADRLIPLVKSTPASRPVWMSSVGLKQPWGGPVRMLKCDLRAAQIPYRDEAGKVFDFHALRAQFGSDLARAGVSIQHAQKLMRHASPVLTARAYTLLDRADMAGAVEKLSTKPDETFTADDLLRFYGLLWCSLWCRE